MRRRPKVRVLLERQPLEPQGTFHVDVVLTSLADTPTEAIDVTLTSEVATSVPEGKGYSTQRLPLSAPQRYRWTPGTLAKGEHRQRVRFDLGDRVPPSYTAARGWCRVSHFLEVHVQIPYWLDRRARFVLPVAATPRVPDEPKPALVATRTSGQVAGELYVEASLETTQLAPGVELRGSVSFGNVGVKRIRRVELAFVLAEEIRRPLRARNTVTRYAATLGSGAPPEGEGVPFRLALPKDAPPGFDTEIFALRWSFEVRADVVLGSDVVLAIPLDVLRPMPGASLPSRPRRAVPVGNERLARLWTQVAERVGLAYDAADGTMIASRGPVSLTLAREVLGGTLGIVAHYHYPHLGLDVRLGERGFFDALSRGFWDERLALARFTVVGREPRQLDAFFDEALSVQLSSATRVELDDDDAHVHVAGAASSRSALENVARGALHVLALLEAATARVPVPAMMQPFETAWRDFAREVGGRFEPGRVFVHDATLGGFRFEIGTVWEPDEPKPIGTLARVPIEPPLERAPDVEDASLSAGAREALRALLATEGFHADTGELGLLVHAVTEDPRSLLSKVEAMVAVLRAMRGSVTAGPFR